MPAGRPKIYKDVETLQKQINAYFNKCDIDKEPYTITGLAMALDLDRKTLYNYSKDDEFFPTIKKAKLKVENYLEKHLITDNSTTGIIFNLKNNFDWKDRQELEHSGNINNPFAGMTTEELREMLNE